MAKLADHLVNIKFMRDQIEARSEKNEDGERVMTMGIFDRLLVKKYTDECAATFFSHIEEIIALVPAGDIIAADSKLQKEMKIPPEVGEIIDTIIDAIRSRHR